MQNTIPSTIQELTLPQHCLSRTAHCSLTSKKLAASKCFVKCQILLVNLLIYVLSLLHIDSLFHEKKAILLPDENPTCNYLPQLMSHVYFSCSKKFVSGSSESVTGTSISVCSKTWKTLEDIQSLNHLDFRSQFSCLGVLSVHETGNNF